MAQSPVQYSVSQPLGEDTEPISIFGRAALLFWFATIVILYSRFFDLALNGFFIPRIVIALMILFFFVSGRAFTFARSAVGKVMILWFLWVSVTMFFSVWRTGSLPLYQTLIQSILLFIVAAGLPSSVQDVAGGARVVAFAGLLVSLMCFVWGETTTGRLELIQGSYHDPNYLAMSLILVLPLLADRASSSKSYVAKAFYFLCMLPILWTFFKAGSRGALVGFAVMLLTLFFYSSVRVKAMLVLAVIFGATVGITLMPSYIRARYLTLLDGAKVAETSDDERLGGDTNSAEDRKRLLMTSIDLTFEHPLFGVGPGNFPTAVFDEGRAKGRQRNEWLVTHNSYTEISSETGLIGFVLFVTILFLTFKNIFAVLKQAKPSGAAPDPRAYSLAKSLLFSFITLCVTIFFLAVGFEFTIYLFAGLAASLRRTAAQRLQVSAANREVEAAVEAPAPILPRPPSRVSPQERVPAHASAAKSVRFNRYR